MITVDERSRAPIVVCDECGEQITEGGNVGWYVGGKILQYDEDRPWRSTSEHPSVILSPLYHTHKTCHAEFEHRMDRKIRQNGYRASMETQELDLHLHMLWHNTQLNRQETISRVKFYAETGAVYTVPGDRAGFMRATEDPKETRRVYEESERP